MFYSALLLHTAIIVLGYITLSLSDWSSMLFKNHIFLLRYSLSIMNSCLKWDCNAFYHYVGHSSASALTSWILLEKFRLFIAGSQVSWWIHKSLMSRACGCIHCIWIKPGTQLQVVKICLFLVSAGGLYILHFWSLSMMYTLLLKKLTIWFMHRNIL